MSQNTVEINITADVMEAQAELKSLQKQLQELVNIQNDSLNKFDERTDQFQEHIKTSIEKVKGNIDQVIGKIEEFKGQDIGTKLQVSLNNTSSALSSFGNMVKTAFVYDVAFQAINKLEDALKELAKGTLEVDASFEQLKVGIAGQLSANLNFSGSTKTVANEQSNFNIAMGKSEEVFNRLRQASANTGIPLEQLGKGFMGAVGPATRAGMSVEELTNFVEKMSSVAKATSIPMNMLGREIRDLMTGQRSQLSLEMGVTEAWINHHKAVGDLAQAYVDMAAKYEPMVEAQKNTWNAIKNSAVNNLQLIENEASKDIFAKLKETGRSLQNSLSENMGRITVAVRDGLDKSYDYIYSFYVNLKVIFGAIKPVIDTLIFSLGGLLDLTKLLFEGTAKLLARSAAGWQELWAVVKNIGNNLSGLFTTLNKMQQEFFNGDFSGAKQRWNDYTNSIKDNAKKSYEEIYNIQVDLDNKLKEIDDARDSRIKRQSDSKAPNLLKSDNTPIAREENEKKKPKGSSNELQLLEEELNKKKILHEQSIQDEIDFWKSKLKPSQEGLAIYSDIVGKIASLTERQRSEEKSKQQSNIQIIESGLAESKALGTLKIADEVSTWEAYLNSVNKGSKEYLAVLNKFNEAKKRLDEENYKNAMQSLSKEETEALATLEYKHTMNTESLSGSKRDNDQKIAEEISFQNKMFNLKMSFLQRELSLAGKDDSKVSATNNKIEALTRSHNVTMNKLDVQAATERDKVWQRSQSIVENSFGKAINDVIMKTKTLGQAFRSMFSSILSGLAGMLAQWAAHWVAQHAIDLIATKTATTAKVGIEAAANTTIGVEATTAATTAQAAQAPIKAAEATGLVAMATMGAFASQAAIPIVGPALAATAAATTTSLLSPMITIASASGGYDIPNGVNPMTQLHQNEMVLPAHIAQPLRESIKGGGVGGGHTYNINVQAMDARGVKSFMMDNQDALVSAMKSAHRNSMR